MSEELKFLTDPAVGVRSVRQVFPFRCPSLAGRGADGQRCGPCMLWCDGGGDGSARGPEGDCGTSEGSDCPFYIMDLSAGETADERYPRPLRIDPPEAVAAGVKKVWPLGAGQGQSLIVLTGDRKLWMANVSSGAASGSPSLSLSLSLSVCLPSTNESRFREAVRCRRCSGCGKRRR